MSAFDESVVLGRYRARYFRCDSCAFVQAVDPIWLEEAYKDAITSADIGPVFRCDLLSKRTKALIHTCFDPAGRFIDYGGGYGLFVRRMRDLGYDFYWSDRYCENIFARGFEADPHDPRPYDILTAFEVLEHLPDPRSELARMADLAPNLFVTTELVPFVAPKVADWWYYGPDHGQHISFFSHRSLEVVAEQLGRHLYSNGFDLHLLTRERISPARFRLVTNHRFARWFDVLKTRPTLLAADFAAVLEAQRAASAPPSDLNGRRSSSSDR
jgi:hypothetical protein